MGKHTVYRQNMEPYSALRRKGGGAEKKQKQTKKKEGRALAQPVDALGLTSAP